MPVTINDIAASLVHGPTPYPTRALREITSLVVHHTVTPTSVTPAHIAAFHVNNRAWPGIGYHYVIAYDGAIYQTQPLTVVSNHVGSYDRVSIGVSLVGDFTFVPPPPPQLEAAAQLLAYLRLQFKAQFGAPLAVVGHKELAATECPGRQWTAETRYRDTLLARIAALEVAADRQSEVRCPQCGHLLRLVIA